MSVTSSSGQHAAGLAHEREAASSADRTYPAGGLNRPVRAVVALVEVLLAAGAVWLAFAAWSEGVSTISGEGEVTSTRYHGNWIGIAILLGGLASLLLLDAMREMILAIRTRRPRH